MSQYTRSIDEAPPPFSPLFSPSQESSPQPSMYSRSPSPTPLAHRTQQQPTTHHRPTQSHYRASVPAPPSAATAYPTDQHEAAYYHSEEPPPHDVDVLLSPSFSLPLSNSDNSAPHSPALSPSPQLQSPFTPRSPAHSSASSTNASTGGPLTLQPWQLSLFHTHYPHLSQLNLSHNRLIGLCSFHSVCFSLRTLNLSYNLLPASSLPHLASLTALDVLSLAHNNIDSLSSLPPLPSLTSIDLSSNCLSLTSAHLTTPISRSLPQLQRLALSGNPFCSSDRGYRLRVIDALRECRQLTWLDGLPLEEERRGLGERAVSEESKEQMNAQDSDGGDRRTGPLGTERKRVDLSDEVDSKYGTAAVPFVLPTAAISSPLFTSPFVTPQQSRPASASKEREAQLHHLSSAPVTHHHVDFSDGPAATTLTATPLAPAQPAPATITTGAGSAIITQLGSSARVVASPLPHSNSLSAVSSQQPASSQHHSTMLNNSEQESRIAALEAELRQMRAQLRDTAAAAVQPNEDTLTVQLSQPAASPSKSTVATHFTIPLRQANDAYSLPTTSSAPSLSQLSHPPTSSASLSSLSPSSYNPLLFDLQQSRRQCDDLRSQIAGLQHVITLQEQTLSARLNVDTNGLSLWRHALVQLVRKQREDEGQREQLAEEKREADRRWQQEREQKAAELDVLKRTAEKARDEIWKREDELSRMRVQQSQAEDRIERLEHKIARQSMQLSEASAGLVALGASQQSVGSTYERAERMLAAASARLHFACQRVAVIQQLHVIDKGVRVAQVSGSGGISAGSSLPSTGPLGPKENSLLIRRELDRLRHDNTVLLQRHADAVSHLRSEHTKEAADSAARLNVAEEQLNALRVQYQAAIEENARLSGELSDVRIALSRHQAELVGRAGQCAAGERAASRRKM